MAGRHPPRGRAQAGETGGCSRRFQEIDDWKLLARAGTDSVAGHVVSTSGVRSVGAVCFRPTAKKREGIQRESRLELPTGRIFSWYYGAYLRFHMLVCVSPGVLSLSALFFPSGTPFLSITWRRRLGVTLLHGSPLLYIPVNRVCSGCCCCCWAESARAVLNRRNFQEFFHPLTTHPTHQPPTARVPAMPCHATPVTPPKCLVCLIYQRDQLPGIVTLRLAADFLVDYVWRRYWGPQAEHLGFVWGAFDRLFSRWAGGREDVELALAGLHCTSLGSMMLGCFLSRPPLPSLRDRGVRLAPTPCFVFLSAPPASCANSRTLKRPARLIPCAKSHPLRMTPTPRNVF